MVYRNVDDETVEGFQRDGAAVLRGVLDVEWIERLAEGVEHNRANPSEWAHWYTHPDQSIGFWADYVTWTGVDAYRETVFGSGLAEAAATLMRSPTARFFHEHVLVKEPGAQERTPWHHDQPYYPIDGDQNVSMWVPLDPVPEEAALRFLAGSHRWGRWFIPRKFIDHTPYGPEDGRYEYMPDVDGLIAGDPEHNRVLSFATEPGDVIVFHYRTLHDAPGNPSARTSRRAVSLRWLGADATWAHRPWPVSPPFEDGPQQAGAPIADDPRFPVVATHHPAEHSIG
jgi:hypothetical protein